MNKGSPCPLLVVEIQFSSGGVLRTKSDLDHADGGEPKIQDLPTKAPGLMVHGGPCAECYCFIFDEECTCPEHPPDLGPDAALRSQDGIA